MSRKAWVVLIVLLAVLAVRAVCGVMDYMLGERKYVTAVEADVPGYGTVAYGWYRTPALFRPSPVYYEFLSWEKNGRTTQHLIASSNTYPQPTWWTDVRLWKSTKYPGIMVSRGKHPRATLDLRTGEFLDFDKRRVAPALSLVEQAAHVRSVDSRSYPDWATREDSKLLAKFTPEEFHALQNRHQKPRP